MSSDPEGTDQASDSDHRQDEARNCVITPGKPPGGDEYLGETEGQYWPGDKKVIVLKAGEGNSHGVHQKPEPENVGFAYRSRKSLPSRHPPQRNPSRQKQCPGEKQHKVLGPKKKQRDSLAVWRPAAIKNMASLFIPEMIYEKSRVADLGPDVPRRQKEQKEQPTV